jgi:hypothetical protein
MKRMANINTDHKQIQNLYLPLDRNGVLGTYPLKRSQRRHYTVKNQSPRILDATHTHDSDHGEQF